MIDPVLQQMMDAMAASGFALPDPITPVSLRAALDTPFPVAPIPIAEVRDVQVAGADGTIPARLYHPVPGTTLPVAVMIHGGGWVIGTLDTHDGMARALAQETGCAILSLGYRLAPEFPYPAPLDDCLAAIAELPSRAAEFGVKAEGYAVVGDSAGGNLAAAVSLALVGKPNAPSHQVLFYPALDKRFDTPSYLAAPDEGILTTGMMRWFWEQYVGDAEPDALAAPTRATSLEGLAPATVILALNDPLHDEGFDYGVALSKAGVPTDIHSFSGAIHGFASFFGVAPIADQAIGLAAGALKVAFQRQA